MYYTEEKRINCSVNQGGNVFFFNNFIDIISKETYEKLIFKINDYHYYYYTKFMKRHI